MAKKTVRHKAPDIVISTSWELWDTEDNGVFRTEATINPILHGLYLAISQYGDVVTETKEVRKVNKTTSTDWERVVAGGRDLYIMAIGWAIKNRYPVEASMVEQWQKERVQVESPKHSSPVQSYKKQYAKRSRR